MGNGNKEWPPERIRSLRGDASRAQFAERVGVSALTVYRWELPDGSPEARRPRGQIARRLAAMFGGDGDAPAPPADPAAPVPRGGEPAADELVELLPILDRLLDGEFARCETDLLALFASGRLRSIGARALATQALARYQLWCRGDALGAFATLMPALQQAGDGALPASVELEVHVTAALLFASFDGRIFDPGKVNAHVARAEPLLGPQDDVPRFLLWNVQLLAAHMLGDPALIEHVLARRDQVNRDQPWVVLRYFAGEAQVIQAYFARRPGQAVEEFGQLLELAGAHRLALFHARALGQAARNAIDEARPPDAVLALTTRAGALSSEAGLVVGVHRVFLGYAEGEALHRLGRFAEAEDAWRQALQACDELRWAPGMLVFLVIRSMLLTGRAHEVRAHAERIARMRCDIYARIMRELQEAAAGVADVVDDVAPGAAVDRVHAAVYRLDQEENAWTFLRRGMALVNATTALLAGDDAQIARAFELAERTLDAAPAAWAAAALDGLAGARLLRAGRHARARVRLERARDSLDAAGDRVTAAIAERLLALIALDLDEADAASAVARTGEALAALGIVGLGPLEQRARPEAEPAGADDGAPRALADGFQRITARGLPAPAIHRELVAAIAELAPGACVQLDELDAAGAATVVHRAGPGSAPTEWVGLGDGAGRRYQLGVGGEPTPARSAALAILAGAAGLALEVAALRGLAPSVAAAAPADAAVPDLPGFIAASAAMRRLKLDLARLARSRSTIIITGESGAGKEVVARALHDLSVRAGRPYVAFNCAAIPRDLFEGQLFGYRKGAFTGAAADHPGVIRAAQGGTLFLDEIGELPLEVQPKLLRFLENGEVFPLGDSKPVHVDVRVIAATLRDLEQLVRDGRFREDLFYRLQVVPLRVPPLRERPEDVVALARFFIDRLTADGEDPPVLSPGALVALTAHAWPGNVRELRNVIERSLAFEPRPAVLDADHLRIT